MKFNLAFTTVVVSAACAAAEDITLTVLSDNSEVKGMAVSNTHEGAGLNYLFIGAIYRKLYVQYLTAMEHFMAMSVSTSVDVYTFDGNLLALNGSTKNFYACKNTGDPYEYSASSYEVMYYASDAPSSCLSIQLSKAGSSANSSSSSDATASSTADSSSIIGNSTSQTIAYENATEFATVTCTETQCQVSKSAASSSNTAKTDTTILTETCTEAKCTSKASSTKAAITEAPASTLSTSVSSASSAISVSGSSTSSALSTFSAAAEKIIGSKSVFAMGLAALLVLL
ncbi:hypothetical protein BRETT_000045 [Brettanomyces bruxellensis]|uniref:Uncharacterized protein n=2 Tax=Dekkera bruxellensis TaxID=5007 RepID=A0A871QYP5_DEKBR|nr:uncharacterized protein BRETT_000045 [Brettanomyces bruxellensis]QOU18323.1 hypothetical protein BRETT_000045 [Brettanomyces bruxellensis]